MTIDNSTYVFLIVNIMRIDDLAMLEARASLGMVLVYFLDRLTVRKHAIQYY